MDDKELLDILETQIGKLQETTEAVKKRMNKPPEPDKKPLFTTVDGVEIFEGDSYYFIGFGGVLQKTKGDGEQKYPDMLVKRFSTREAAEKDVMWNKPCLSGKDVKDFIIKVYGNISFGAKDELETLVKSKP